MARVAMEDAVVTNKRLVVTTKSGKGVGETAESGRELRLQHESAFEVDDGVVRAVQGKFRKASIVMADGICGFKRQHLVKVVDRFREVTFPGPDNAQHASRVGIRRNAA
jgi:hypothetical protein